MGEVPSICGNRRQPKSVGQNWSAAAYKNHAPVTNTALRHSDSGTPDPYIKPVSGVHWTYGQHNRVD
jgi:hypothetical protein